MAKNNIWKTLAGLAVIGAAVGGAVACAKKYKDHSSLAEEDFDELLDEEEEKKASEPAEERTYTTLPTEDAAPQTAEKEPAEESEEKPEEEPAEDVEKEEKKEN